MLESGDIASELLEGSGYEEMINFADTMMESVNEPYQDELNENPEPRSPRKLLSIFGRENNDKVQLEVEETVPAGHP